VDGERFQVTAAEHFPTTERLLNISAEELERNIKNSFQFPQFKLGENKSEGAVVICAAGPSLLPNFPLIKRLSQMGIQVCAVKGTADLLVENGIVPTYAVSMDGKPDQVRFFKHPHPEIEYLIAGQSHPDVFEALKGYRVTVWHGEGKRFLPPGTDYVQGGSTTGTRAICLMWARGFLTHHLFGFDCCEIDDETHVYPINKPQKLTEVYLGTRKFRATGQMICQYEELINFFANKRLVNVVVHGNGMLARAWQLLNERSLVPLDTAPRQIPPRLAQSNAA
jgi:uncharacterized Rossmann fold enzyme